MARGPDSEDSDSGRRRGKGTGRPGKAGAGTTRRLRRPSGRRRPSRTRTGPGPASRSSPVAGPSPLGRRGSHGGLRPGTPPPVTIRVRAQARPLSYPSCSYSAGIGRGALPRYVELSRPLD